MGTKKRRTVEWFAERVRVPGQAREGWCSVKGQVISMAQAAARRSVRIHTAAMKALVDEARDRVLDARRRYMAVDARDTRAMVQAQSLLLLALEQRFDAVERASGRRQ